MIGRRILSYIDGKSPIHSLTGAAKLICFILWSILVMVSFQTPILILLVAAGIIFFIVSKIRFRDISFIFKLMLIFITLNLITVYLFSPEQGTLIYMTRNVITEGYGRFTLSWEQLFYEFNIMLKYVTVIPPALMLILTTHPSEFASSLNRIGVPYSAAYAVSLTLRYIPDVQRDFETIYQAQQARGLELSGKASLIKRIKRIAPILLPLIILSIERIDVISRAMELRGFGKNKKRTWYSSKPFRPADIAVIIVSALLFTAGIWYTFRTGNRFYNPFE
jgi:energy-coupling factor transport system permease protein